MKKFENYIILFGFGAVGQSALTILEKEIGFDKDKLTIIDKAPRPFHLDYRYVQAELRPEDHEKIFSKYISKGGLFLDFTSETDCLETIKWCYEKEIMYISTGDNEWPENDWKNIYGHYLDNEEFFKTCKKDCATIIVHHGANPGAVSYFVKKGLYDIAADLINGDTDLDKKKLKRLLHDKKWGELAEYLEVRTVHSSDRDTQVIDEKTINPDLFYSTWNPYTFFNECTCRGEARIGTAEKFDDRLKAAYYNPKDGAIELALRGTEYYSKTWTPDGEFYGMIVGHEEVFSISDCLSVYHPDGTLRYRPTVYFSYLACDLAMESLKKTAKNGYVDPDNYILIREGVIAGTEHVGILIMGNKFKSRWVGNRITLDRIKKFFPGKTPTILQVAIPAIAAASYIVEHRNAGVNYPDTLPYDEILPVIEKYADKSISVTTDFTVKHNMAEDFVERSILK